MAPKKRVKKAPVPPPPPPESDDDDDILHFTPAAYNEDTLDVSFAPLQDFGPAPENELTPLPEADLSINESEAVEESCDGGGVGNDGDYADEDEVTETATELNEEDVTHTPASDGADDSFDVDITPPVVFKHKRPTPKPHLKYVGVPLEIEESSDDDASNEA